MESLRKATEFIMDITYPDYTMDNFNDTRSARLSKSVLIKNFKRYVEMFPDNENMKWMATEGNEGKPTYLTKAYKYSGYYILRNGWDAGSTMLILKTTIIRMTNGTVNQIMVHSVYIVTDVIFSLIQEYSHIVAMKLSVMSSAKLNGTTQ